MNFITRILKILDETPHKALVTEVDGPTLLPTVGTELGRLVKEARGALFVTCFFAFPSFFELID